MIFTTSTPTCVPTIGCVREANHPGECYIGTMVYQCSDIAQQNLIDSLKADAKLGAVLRANSEYLDVALMHLSNALDEYNHSDHGGFGLAMAIVSAENAMTEIRALMEALHESR